LATGSTPADIDERIMFPAHFDISLIMGGLISRYKFSQKYFSKNIWRSKIKHYLCTRFPKKVGWQRVVL
jgi:hypothetical protein